jgi:hypothetical protein
LLASPKHQQEIEGKIRRQFCPFRANKQEIEGKIRSQLRTRSKQVKQAKQEIEGKNGKCLGLLNKKNIENFN